MWLWIALAGGLGAAARFVVDALITAKVVGPTRDRVPLGSVTVNLTGSLLAGVMAAAATGGWLHDEVRTIVAGGFLGAYTTFSTAVYEATWLLERGERTTAVVHLLMTMVGSVVAAVLGFRLVG